MLGLASKNGVSTMPGAMIVVRIPVSLRSARMASPIAWTACLVAEYREPGSGLRPAIDPVRSTWPRLSLRAGIAARTV
jgi:hypothetical protein